MKGVFLNCLYKTLNGFKYLFILVILGGLFLVGTGSYSFIPTIYVYRDNSYVIKCFDLYPKGYRNSVELL